MGFKAFPLSRITAGGLRLAVQRERGRLRVSGVEPGGVKPFGWVQGERWAALSRAVHRVIIASETFLSAFTIMRSDDLAIGAYFGKGG